MKRIRRFHANSRSYLITCSHVSGAKAGELQLFDEAIREKFVEKLNDYAVFCGVDVFAYSVLPETLQILVKVRAPEKLSDDELLGRLAAIYHPLTVDEVREELEAARARGEEALAMEIRARYLRRMWDLSNFMKELLAWISQWVNRERERTGTLFEDRFRSVVVENDPAILEMLGAYLELAAVRKGIVENPEDWRWSTGGAALSGSRIAQRALQRLLQTDFKREQGILEGAYLEWKKSFIDQESIPNAEESKTYAQMLRTEVAYFTHGRAIGNWSFYAKLMTGEREAIDWVEWAPMEGGDFRGGYAAKAKAYALKQRDRSLD